MAYGGGIGRLIIEEKDRMKEKELVATCSGKVRI